jgi:tRNA dimethylallyltransferase
MAPLIVITGPTASGKTGLALDLAERYGGEIICADSRTIYKGMDIGTAKPTEQERSRVPHHLLDVVLPGEIFTAKDFQAQAKQAIATIRSRGNIPFIVGGTGLYIDAVVLEYQWPELASERDRFEGLANDELIAMIKKQQLALPENPANRRHLISTLIRGGAAGSALTLPRENCHVVAIATDKSVLEDRIRERAKQMFGQGVVEETKRLGERYGWDSEAMTSNIYPIIRRVIEGEISEPEAVELFVIKDRQLAKRQVTWLKRHDFVHWLPLEEARGHIETILTEVC